MAKKQRSTKTAEKSVAKEKPVAKATKKESEVPELTEEFIEDLQNDLSELHEELKTSKRFAASSKRARKTTSNLEKKFKLFRKASVNYWKKD